MGKHRESTKVAAFWVEKSVDAAMVELSQKVGVTKSDLIRRFVVEGMANINQLSDWRRFIRRPRIDEK